MDVPALNLLSSPGASGAGLAWTGAGPAADSLSDLAGTPAGTAARPAATPSPPRVPRVPEPRPTPPPLTVCADLVMAAAVLDAQLGRCRRQARLATLVWVDVVVGDADAARSLLQAMGQRLRHRVRATDSVMQVGHQGFAVLLIDAGEQASTHVRDRLDAVLQGPYRVAGGRVAPLLMRLGRAVHGLDGQDAEALLRVAARLGATSL